jgi:protein-L-isoaspartate(D-aspartate) O-methyltransferase
MNLEQARFNMIEQQIRPWDIVDSKVLDLLFIVKREAFVPVAYQDLAFADTELPLGHDAVMLAPKIEAHALQALAMKPHEKVLEVGTGSGYMAALLGAHADHVWSLEIVPELAAVARENLRLYGVSNVTVETGDGLQGMPAQAPFDVIMISGAVSVVPPELLAQLKVGGRLFAIVGEAPAMQAQLITRVNDSSYSTVTQFESSTELLKAPPAQKFVF